MPSKQATTAGCLFSELLIAESEKHPDMKVTDQEVGRWFVGSAAMGARIRRGDRDGIIQDYRNVLFTPGARPLLIALTAGTPFTFVQTSVEPIDADRDGAIGKNDVALLAVATAQKGLAKIASIQKHATGNLYTPTAMNELESAAASVIESVNQTVATARACAMTGTPRLSA